MYLVEGTCRILSYESCVFDSEMNTNQDQRLLLPRPYNRWKILQILWGRSHTTWTKFWPFLTTYLPIVDSRGHLVHHLPLVHLDKVGYFLKLGIILAELSSNLRCWNYFAQLKTSCNLLKICKETSYIQKSFLQEVRPHYDFYFDPAVLHWNLDITLLTLPDILLCPVSFAYEY